MQSIFSNLNSSFSAYAPGILGAVVLLLVAWLVASLARIVVRRVARASRIDQRVHGSGIGEALAQGTFWLVLLVSLPGILASLRLQNVLLPIQGMLNRLFAFLPNLFGAILICVIGFFVAGLIRKIATGLLNAAGLDAFAARMGLPFRESHSLSGVIGLVVYVLILIPVIDGALNALSLEALSGPLSSMMNTLLAAIPNIFAATLIVGFSVVIGRLVSSVLSTVLLGLGFDSIPERLGFRARANETGRSASDAVGKVALVAILLFGLMEASHILGFTALSALILGLTVFGSKLLMGLVIFCVGLFLANLAASSILRSDVENPKLLATVARVSILFVVAAMALGQMGLAKDIVNLAFGLLLGAVAAAVAIAFGIGGRETASRVIAQLYSTARSPELVLKMDSKMDSVKRDVA
jgi:hypothetical protein